MTRFFKPLYSAGIVALLLTVGSPALAQNKVIATVGELQVTEQELTFAEADLGKQFAQLPAEQKRGAILSALIDIKLLASEAQSKGLADEENFRAQMEFVRTRALHNLYFQQQAIETITDEEVKERFDKEVAALTPEKQIKARHILLKTEDEAKAVIADLESGKEFVELAKEKSTGPSGPNGGDLGFFGKGQMVPEFEQAAFGLENGQFTKTPVKTQFGFHVILREEDRDEPLPKFEDAEDQVRQAVLRDKYFAMIEAVREKTSVTILDPELKAAVDAVKSE